MSNLHPSKSWKKGQSGNLKGRPEHPWKEVFRKRLSEKITTKAGKKVIIQEALADALIGEGLKGDVHAINSLMNRMDGMPDQAVKGEIKGNINISFHESLKQKDE